MKQSAKSAVHRSGGTSHRFASDVKAASDQIFVNKYDCLIASVPRLASECVITGIQGLSTLTGFSVYEGWL